jgi:hypothetical protein
MRKSALGWGRNTWPKVGGMESIDNYYLQLTLMHGLTALSFFIAILVSMMVRLGRLGARIPNPRSDEAMLAFTLLSIFAAVAFSIATVFLGTQLMPLLAVLCGWAEGFLLAPKKLVSQARAVAAPLSPYSFRRVVT